MNLMLPSSYSISSKNHDVIFFNTKRPIALKNLKCPTVDFDLLKVVQKDVWFVIIIIIYLMELGHLLTRSCLTYPEASSKVCHGSFCQLGNSVWSVLCSKQSEG
jgi:hypothetical protein